MKLAKIIRFYHLSFKEVSSLGAHEIQTLWASIDVLEAQETIVATTVASWPSLKDTRRKELASSLKKSAYPEGPYGGKKEATKDLSHLAKMLGG